jgi:small GTP-binding protein
VSLRLDIWDTGGSEKYRALAPMYYREARAAVIVLDATSRDAISGALSWIDELRRHARKDIILVAAANKIDVDGARVLSSSDVESFGFQNQLDYCFEVSAKTGANVGELFRTLCEALVRLPPLESPDGMLLPQDIAGDRGSCPC